MPAHPTTAVVVHYVRADLTDDLVHDLLTVAAGSVDRVVVVDNGSPQPYTPAHHLAVEVVRLATGRGYAGAVRAGRQRVQGSHFLLLNNDVRLPHDPVPALLACAERCGAALVGPRVEFPDGRYQLSWGDDLGLVEERRERARQRQMRAGGGPGLSAREAQSRVARPVDWLSGVALLVQSAAFDAVGGFDEEFFFYFEDVDLCRRLSAAGHPLWYEPAARVAHLLGGTRDGGTVAVPERVATAHVRGHLLYYRRHRPGWETAVLKAALLAQVALSPAYRRQPWQRSLLLRTWKD
jgi:GT2 family glycosyltransferase